MNTLNNSVIKYNANVRDKITSACRNYIHHLATGDYVRHRSSPQTLADHSRTLEPLTVDKEYRGFIFSTNGVIP